ncbi:hypothetical protein FIBSPDRAFT_864760 [Athelia psychrophila]|uniref:RanBD1 domain-containing protein n=1 Tax=Athelia psychrophila TaxID=1759441 RepID=A0A166G8N3_9AGAM|nr:hypothetical protein FIBSPDRAFT_864760 [Fibularhizoctonia sp. CBS 109695]
MHEDRILRGNKAFTGGMPGHIKRLAHSERADQRLLFRREPLGKVSMNVPMSPAVRCSFDAEDGILRIVLKEAITAEGGNGAGTHELVVYAIKRGRVPKQDFTEFAETLTAAYAPKAEAGTT